MRLGAVYPRSFLQLLSIGFILVALPLVIGLIANAVSIRRLSTQSQQAVFQASQVSQASRGLIETLASQERAARQYLILRDPALQERYLTLHQYLDDTAGRLAALPLNDSQQQELAALRRQAAELHRALTVPPSPSALTDRQVAERFASLATAAQLMLQHNNEAIDHEIAGLRELAADAERMMLLQLAALLPVVAFLVIGFTRLLAHPIAQMEAAIGGLWAGRFERRIAVDGPRDLQSLGEQLDRLRLRLVALEEQKSRFLRQVSHELKTPLTALREGSDLLAEEAVGPLNSKQKELARILTDNSLHLRQLIEDLLNYSAADFEQAALRRQVFPLEELVAAVVEKQRLAWSARQLAVDLDLAPIALNADRERIRTVLDNLLSNAIKYSPPGGRITIAARNEDGGALIEVADQGPGIPEEDREHIFDPFYQGRIPAAGPVKGSGLGLSISREHVLAHGGQISLLPGAGARFRVRLPLQ
ncbi:sensor histidine kinase [Denitratisoma sp. DHT3]|uniref:sensor histidine kinase n=1 Tax=Denitratisoma sp. DHT3 TaxID=1981880 RepID=UPI00164735A8|nr:ATP-binding protein [Denitratisoma sp. DHT3]